MAGTDVIFIGAAALTGSVGIVCIVRSLRRRRIWSMIGGVASLGAAVILFAAISKLASSRAQSACQSNLRCVEFAIEMYREESGHLPENLEMLVDCNFLTPKQIRSRLGRNASGESCGYALLNAGNWQGDVPGIRVFERSDSHGDGTRCVLYTSGEVRVLNRSAFASDMHRFSKEYQRLVGKRPQYAVAKNDGYLSETADYEIVAERP